MSQTKAWFGLAPDGTDSELGTFDLIVAGTIGGTGAVTQIRGAGFVTLTRVSAGLYRITFDAGPVYALVHADAQVQLLAATTGGVVGNVTTDSSTSTSAPLVEVTYYADNTTATDPASGNVITIRLKLKLWGNP